MTSVEEQSFKYAIKNAALHNGKADAGALVGKLKALFPDEDIRSLAAIARETVERVNAMPLSEIQQQFAEFEAAGYELKPREKEKGLPPLEWANTQKVVTRFAPNPNGPMHFGHCRAALLCAQYAKMYNGTFILRFEDTDPKVKKPIEDAEKMYRTDLKWLHILPDKTVWASKRFDSYYAHMREVIGMGKAYVCSCDNDAFKKLKNAGIACPHRELAVATQQSEFDKMLSHAYREGQAVLRIKTDLSHPDLSVRDWWAAKIVDSVSYSRLKSRVVFPSFNFQNAVDDHFDGVTLIIRGIQHAQNAVKQKYLYDYFGWTFPHLMHFGLMRMKGVVLSKSKISELAKTAPNFLGWNDPRLGTVGAFREKGFVAQAIIDEVNELGIRLNDASVSLERIEDRNKHIIDKDATRFIFIQNAVEVIVTGSPPLRVQMENYPGDATKGHRTYALSKERTVFWIDAREAENARLGLVFRLKHAYNVRVVKKDGKKIDCAFVSLEHKSGIPIVNWLLPSHIQKAVVRLRSSAERTGYSEKALSRIKRGAHVRFEDFGFLVVREKGKTQTALNYTHP